MAGLPYDDAEYDGYIEKMRDEQYPMLRDAIYLDHAGTTLYSKNLMDRFHADMVANLYGNPHSASPSSQRSTQAVEDVRVRLLRLFKADPNDFDLVFTANATAAIKLVMEGFRGQANGFSYGYHVDSHTSLVGVREAARDHVCFETDAAVEQWIDDQAVSSETDRCRLLAYPAQSNMSGRRLPLSWCETVRRKTKDSGVYTLLDAAAFVSTSALDFTDVEAAPDFTALSFYKIFGFPDLGALIVRKNAAHILSRRKYFGGGTVDMVACIKEQWHAQKSGAIHEQLEDGTLPVHNIIGLRSALETHEELFGTLERVSAHIGQLAKQLYDGLVSLRHANGKPVSTVYKHVDSTYGNTATQGPVVAFNLKDSQGHWVSNTEVEKLAAIKDVHLRTGGVCNPGGVAAALDLAPWELRNNFSAGHRCGSDNDILNGKPTGIVRVSLGAMSTRIDVVRFIGFVDEFFVDKTVDRISRDSCHTSPFHVESLTVYAIKSCAGWQVPADTPWQIHQEGLAWDREWCIVHQGTGKALSQKQCPRMALIRPQLDLRQGVLRISVACASEPVTVPLSNDPTYFASAAFNERNATVCGDPIKARLYASPTIAETLSAAIGVPCTLARFPSTNGNASMRHSKAHLQQPGTKSGVPRPILLSNESPILTISRSSLNRLNEQIKAKGGKAAHPAVFRANIVVAESPLSPPGHEQPWAEDKWREMRVGGENGPTFDFLGGCRRCQMVCIDQENGEKNQEPFVTLAKTRRVDGKVVFGVHTALADGGGTCATISIGDEVETLDELKNSIVSL